MGAPDQDEKPVLECEGEEKVEEGGDAEILHVLGPAALNRELEVDGEEEEVPHEVDGD